MHILTILLLALMAGSGCAVNTKGLPGFVRVDHAENQHAYRTRLAVWGIYVSTHSIDRGLNIGYTERMYIEPKSIAETDDPDRLLRDLDETNWRPAIGMKSAKPGATGFFCQSTGLSIDTNRHAVGLVIGFQSRFILELDKAYEGVFVVNMNSR